MSTPVSGLQPQPCCGDGSGSGPDVENQVLCDLDAEGNLLGTALAVYEYDSSGALVLPVTYVNPVTGDPYVAQGILQPCPEGTCLPPMQFCQTGTSTGPVEHPGRQYDLTLPINPGFEVQSLQVDAVTHAAGITWDVSDPDGETFRTDLTAFLEGRLPAAATVTITNPNAGQVLCGPAAPMQIHIECLRLDQAPPNLVELIYNAGEDLIINPAYNETPPLSPPVAQGNYGFHLLGRQDNNTYPQNQPANRVNCTSTANRGWETNDVGRTFEIWGGDRATAEGITPTPRGTPVQEMTSDGAPSGGRSTIWQTFTAPASANFNIRIVHGSRDPGEEHRITLDNGDTDDQQNGHLINDVTFPPSVSNNGGPNPWTQFNQTIPLTGGQTYTLALSSTNPAVFNRGGLFTDMRAFIDRPNTRATATTDDETCVVTVDETSTTTTCSFWQPQCVGGTVAGWENVATGLRLSNSEFWAQVPTPQCCTSEAGSGEGGGGSVAANLAVSDVVCGVVGGVPTSLVRQVVLDPSGGTLSQTFIGPSGAPVTPASWVAGSCTDQRFLHDEVLCDRLPDGRIVATFLRKYVQTWSPQAGSQTTEVRDFNLAGTASYTLVGSAVDCSNTGTPADRDTEVTKLCDVQPDGTMVRFLSVVTYDGLGVRTAASFQDVVGGTYVPTGTVQICPDLDSLSLGLCLGDGTPIGVLYHVSDDTHVPVRDGWINLLTGAFSTGAPPPGTMSCGQNLNVQTSDVLCDIDPGTGEINGLVLVQYTYNPDGTIASTELINAVTGAPYVPTGNVTVCPTDTSTPDNDMQALCDVQANGTLVPFIRDYRHDVNGVIVSVTDYTLAGTPYTVTGTVGSCIPRDVESLILCDATPTRFLRTFVYNSAGSVQSFTDTTLAGAPFTPTGAVGVCATTVQADTDFVEEVMSDANGTCFLRLFRFNSVTGALISTTNTTLAGAAFTPVGAVTAGCGTCCPQVLADDLCTNTGSGQASAIRAANGTVTLIDSVTGATVTQANIIPCPDQVAFNPVNAQMLSLADTQAWTSALVTGVATSVTMTVISGTATVVDSNGTGTPGLPAGYSATWEHSNEGVLTPPQSITANGGTTVIVWTQR